MSQHHSSSSSHITSWPPSTSMLALHLTTRAILVLTNTIGLSILFPVGVDAYQVSAIVGASFLTISLTVMPFIIFWNRQLLKRVSKIRDKHRQTSSTEDQLPRFKTKTLSFVTFLDGLGFLAFFIVYIPTVHDATGLSWRWSDTNIPLVFAYGSVSILIAMLLHFILFMTQIFQLHSAYCNRKPKKMVCPHCSHTMTRVSPMASTSSTPPESVAAEGHDDMLGESLVDARISMNPGQEAGTTFKTPRQSEHQSRAVATTTEEGGANEAGEGERDALIAKSG